MAVLKTIFAVIGPSGSGKTTLGNYIRENLHMPELISSTTRLMRQGEKQGAPYYFCSPEEFETLDFVQRSEYAGFYYGITKQEVESKWSCADAVYVILNREGVEQFKAMYHEACKVIFIYCPIEEMEKRMRMRGDSEESIQTRIRYALEAKEMDNKKIADYVVANMDMGSSQEQIRKIMRYIK